MQIHDKILSISFSRLNQMKTAMCSVISAVILQL